MWIRVLAALLPLVLTGGEDAEAGVEEPGGPESTEPAVAGGRGAETATTEDGGASGDVGVEGTATDGDEGTDEGAEAVAEAHRVLAEREAELASANRKVAELRGELKALRAFATGQIVAARDELPEALLAFDPGEGAGLEPRLAWLATAREQAGKLTREPEPGAGADPRPAGPAAREIPSPVPIRNMF